MGREGACILKHKCRLLDVSILRMVMHKMVLWQPPDGRVFSLGNAMFPGYSEAFFSFGLNTSQVNK